MAFDWRKRGRSALDAGGVVDQFGLWGDDPDRDNPLTKLANPLTKLADPLNLFGEGGLIDSFSGTDEAEQAEKERQRGNEALEGLRGMIPGQGPPTLQEFQSSPEFQDIMRRVRAGELTNAEGNALAAQLMEQIGPGRRANTVEYEEVDPALFSDPQTIGVSDRLTGYDPSLIDDAAFNRLGVGADRQRYLGAQRDAVARVLGIANEGGLSAIDRARIAEQRAGEEQWLRGQRGATLANMEARGLSGGGTELASILGNEQASANRNALRGVQVEALAQQRQDQALRDAFGMSSEAMGQQNDLARWNSQMTTDAARHRADVRNQGAFSDTADERGIRDYTSRRQDATVTANTDTRNRGIDATRDEGWRFYNANAGITGTQAGQAFNQANALMQQSAADQGRLVSGAGALVGGLLGGGAGASAGAQFGAQPQYQAPPVGTQYRPPSDDDLMDPWES